MAANARTWPDAAAGSGAAMTSRSRTCRDAGTHRPAASRDPARPASAIATGRPPTAASASVLQERLWTRRDTAPHPGSTEPGHDKHTSPCDNDYQ